GLWKDLSLRELAAVVPLLIMTLVIGVYPRPFLSRIEPSVREAIHGAANAATPLFHSSPAPSGASHEPGGIRSSSGSAALRRAATPPWTPGPSPLVARSFGASHEPGGVRSSSRAAALRPAASPPRPPPGFSHPPGMRP